ncbi:S-layer domain protein [Desulfofarcimen acetoxidans DSM 771]|jgi:hypothetical protein|uniref:S-layer domain protein n=1 Tax=Desulfofarcimen acetoxidans (strain ATCC 49208 / DSM 771 / KCTC 5769 / VKM B-1644 / 5575) TaxID=485916 RepID=C8W0W9_DESAS|nr:S-layer homology domain-containing protein [Desulfofarcimen acetoxidans]ACV61538.1 S-layer domain protein [Desulfofarcimen acetoxidans DSM 771]
MFNLFNRLNKCFTVLISVLISVLILPQACTAAAKQKPATLLDIETHWARQQVEKIYALGLVSGYPDYTFRPDQQVNCLEAITMILNSCGYKEQIAKVKQVKNAPPSEYPVPWGQNYLDFALEKRFIPQGIMEIFQYDRPINRAETAAILTRVFGLTTQGNPHQFIDTNSIPETYLAAVQTVYREKIMLCYPDGSFQPLKPILRSELAATLSQAYDQGWINIEPKYKINGWISRVSEDKKDLKIEISSLKESITAAANTDCPCYFQGERFSIKKAVNYRINGILDTNKKIAYLELLEKRNFDQIKNSTYASFINLAEGEPVIMSVKDMLNNGATFPVAWDATIIDEKSKNKNPAAINIFKQLKPDQFIKIGLTENKTIKSITILDIKTTSGKVESIGRSLSLEHKTSSGSTGIKYKPFSFLYWDNARVVDKDGNNTSVKKGDSVNIYYIGEPLYENILEIKVTK